MMAVEYSFAAHSMIYMVLLRQNNKIISLKKLDISLARNNKL